MSFLFRKAKVIYPGHKLHHKKLDFLIEKGVIKEIGTSVKPSSSKTIEIKSKNLMVSLGWLDLRADFSEPGYEERETISTGCKAAAAGGFTGVCLAPSTNPVADSRTSVEYLKKYSGTTGVNLFPIGALSKGLEGEDLAELYDMMQE